MQINVVRAIPVLAVGAVAAGLIAAPAAAADNEFCTGLSTIATKCEKQGDVEVNDSLSRANSSPVFQIAGGSDYGPYLGANGGGAR
jgi:hypothetical protein